MAQEFRFCSKRNIKVLNVFSEKTWSFFCIYILNDFLLIFGEGMIEPQKTKQDDTVVCVFGSPGERGWQNVF